MAGFVKIWTTLRSQDWYLTAPTAVQKCYMEALLIAKEQQDNGQIRCKNTTNLHRLFTINYRTMCRVIAFMQREHLWDVQTEPNGVVTITITDYHYWQGLRRYSDHISNGIPTDKNGTRERIKPSLRSDVSRSDVSRGEITPSKEGEKKPEW